MELALKEDAPAGDITSESIFGKDETCQARLVSRENGILCGSDVFSVLQELCDHQFSMVLLVAEGDSFLPGDVVAEISGNLQTILKIERPLLNFLQYLSGIATQTMQIVKKYPELKILDTRKTIPGYRNFVKYAVYTGGGWNHRLNLSDMAMLKDNHIQKTGSIGQAVATIRKKNTVKIEVEIDHLGQLQEAINAKPEIILLDNFSLQDIKKAVAIIREQKPEIMIEVSGGMTPEKLGELNGFSGIGVSMGFLTHTTRFLDLSLEFHG